MSHWDRRRALELADAIQNKIKLSDTPSPIKSALEPIAIHSAKASLTTQTPCSTVTGLQAQLCTVCRGNQLYRCDRAEGWSPHCAFIDSNRK